VLLLNNTVNIAAFIGLGEIDVPPPVDWRVLTFTALVSLAVGLVSSIGPAIRATAAEAAETLRSAAPAGTRRTFVGTTLSVLQLAASLTLLVGALLLAATIRHLTSIPLGFDPVGLFVFPVQPSTIGYAEPAALEYVAEFQRRLRQIPGVRNAAAANGAPFFGGTHYNTGVGLAGSPRAGSRPEAFVNFVFSTAYFETVDIPLLKGRGFVEADFTAARSNERRVVVLSDGLSRRLFGGADPVGRDIECAGRPGQRCQVVGVAGTARYHTLVNEPEDAVYEPAPARWISSGATMIVRTDRTVGLANQARKIAAALNPALALTEVLSMDDAVGRARRDWDWLARLLGVLALIAAVLSSVGLYGVVAHGVEQRRREFGSRAALGASRGDVWRLVLRQSATIVGAGVAIGLIGAYAFAQTLNSRLVGVSPLDPVLWSAAVTLMVVVAVAASVKPAIAAGRVDINKTLRSL
jgi:predicted permease